MLPVLLIVKVWVLDEPTATLPKSSGLGEIDRCAAPVDGAAGQRDRDVAGVAGDGEAAGLRYRPWPGVGHRHRDRGPGGKDGAVGREAGGRERRRLGGVLPVIVSDGRAGVADAHAERLVRAGRHLPKSSVAGVAPSPALVPLPCRSNGTVPALVVNVSDASAPPVAVGVKFTGTLSGLAGVEADRQRRRGGRERRGGGDRRHRRGLGRGDRHVLVDAGADVDVAEVGRRAGQRRRSSAGRSAMTLPSRVPT